MRPFGLKVINDDDDQGDTVTIGSNWASRTILKVDIINNFDDDQDPDTPITDHNGTRIFELNICE